MFHLITTIAVLLLSSLISCAESDTDHSAEQHSLQQDAVGNEEFDNGFLTAESPCLSQCSSAHADCIRRSQMRNSRISGGMCESSYAGCQRSCERRTRSTLARSPSSIASVPRPSPTPALTHQQIAVCKATCDRRNLDCWRRAKIPNSGVSGGMCESSQAICYENCDSLLHSN